MPTSSYPSLISSRQLVLEKRKQPRLILIVEPRRYVIGRRVVLLDGWMDAWYLTSMVGGHVWSLVWKQSPRAAPTIEEEDYQLPPSFHFCLSNSKRPREPTVHAPASTASSGSASCSSSTSNGSPKRAHMVVPPREPPTAQSPGQQIQMGPFAQQAMSSAKPEGPCTHSLPLPVPSPAPPTESHFATVTSLPQTLPYYGPYVPLQSFDFPTASMMPVPPMAPMVPMPSAQALAMDMEATRHWNSMRWVEGSAPPAPTPAPCTATTIPTPPVPRGPPRGPPQEHRRGANPDRSLLSDADLLELLFLDS